MVTQRPTEPTLLALPALGHARSFSLTRQRWSHVMVARDKSVRESRGEWRNARNRLRASRRRAIARTTCARNARERETSVNRDVSRDFMTKTRAPTIARARRARPRDAHVPYAVRERARRVKSDARVRVDGWRSPSTRICKPRFTVRLNLSESVRPAPRPRCGPGKVSTSPPRSVCRPGAGVLTSSQHGVGAQS